MKFIIIYDIPVDHDPIRTKISNLLLSYNLVRVNFSVFIGNLTYNVAEEIALRIKKLMGRIKGDVRLIPICKTCYSKAITVKSKFEEGCKLIEDILSM